MSGARKEEGEEEEEENKKHRSSRERENAKKTEKKQKKKQFSPKGRYATKWKASSADFSFLSSWTSEAGGAKELWASRTGSLIHFFVFKSFLYRFFGELFLISLSLSVFVGLASSPSLFLHFNR